MGAEPKRSYTVAVCDVCGHNGPRVKRRGTPEGRAGCEAWDLEEIVRAAGWHGGGPFVAPHAVLICPSCVSEGWRYAGGLSTYQKEMTP